MNTLKNIISLTALLMAVMFITTNSVSAQIYNPDIPVIVPFTIDPETINKEVGDTGHRLLTEEYGYVLLPNTYFKQTKNKSLGMIVVHTHTSGYKAYELRCPHCFYDYEETHKMKMVASIPTCSECGAVVDAILFTGSCQLNYDCGSNGPIHMDAYKVIEKRDKRKIKLYITNTEVAIP